MGQLIKTRFHTFLGMDAESRRLRHCGPGDFSEWLFYQRGELRTHQGAVVTHVTSDLVVVDGMGDAADAISIVVKDDGFGIERAGKYLSDRKGEYFAFATELAAWEVFRPQ